jgi:glutathione S-transferase kappa 1
MEAQQKPPNSLPLTRFLLVIQSECPSSTLERISSSIYDVVFAYGDTSIFDSASSITDENVEKLDTAINAKSVGLSKEQIQKYLEKANSKEMKEFTKEEAKRYVKEWNAYGVPHMKFERSKDGQIKHFMGSDRFELIAAW